MPQKIENINEVSQIINNMSTMLETGLSPAEIIDQFMDGYSNAASPEEVQNLILSRNALLRSAVSGQMKERRYFEIEAVEGACSKCKGAGEIYKFARKTVHVNCHICAGEKYTETECPDCEGTGRFKRDFEDGGHVDVKCRKCHGTGTVKVKCSHCRGWGKIRHIITTPRIASTTECPHCEGLGLEPKKSDGLGNTALPEDFNLSE